MKRSPFNMVMLIVFLLVALADIGFARAAHVSGLGQAFGGWFSIAVLISVYYYARFRGFAQFQNLSTLVLWAVAMSIVLSILIQVAGRTPAPLVDADLARIDKTLHFSTGTVVAWITHSPKIRIAFSVMYEGFVPLIFAALFVPTLCGRVKDSQRFVLSAAIALIVTAAMFALWPAGGPWTVFGFEPSKGQAEFHSYLITVLKASGPARIDFGKAGVVTIPSFHVIGALLAVIALWDLRRIRYVALTIALAVCASTVATGWHYLIDVLAALPVVLLSQVLAFRVMRWEYAPADAHHPIEASRPEFKVP